MSRHWCPLVSLHGARLLAAVIQGAKCRCVVVQIKGNPQLSTK